MCLSVCLSVCTRYIYMYVCMHVVCELTDGQLRGVACNLVTVQSLSEGPFTYYLGSI